MNKKLLIILLLIICVLLGTVLGYSAWKNFRNKNTTNIGIQQTDRELSQGVIRLTSGDLQGRDLPFQFKDFRIDKIYPTKDSTKFWTVVTRPYYSGTNTTLDFIDTNSDDVAKLQAIEKFGSTEWRIEYIDKNQAVVREEPSGAYYIYYVDKICPRCSLPLARISFTHQSDATIDVFTGRDDEAYLMNVLKPIYSRACETLKNSATTSPLIDLIGGSMVSVYHGANLTFSFAEPIVALTCEGWKDYGETLLSPPVYDHAYNTGNISSYVYPDVKINWPGGLTVFFHIDKYLKGKDQSRLSAERLFSFFVNDHLVAIQKEQIQPILK